MRPAMATPGTPPPDDDIEAAGGRHAGDDSAGDRDTVGSFLTNFPIFGLAQKNAVTPEQFLDRDVDGYRIVGILGEGGMSWVFRAEQKVPQRLVAIKVGKPEAAERLVWEANVLNGISHKGIAPVFGGGYIDFPNGPLPYMVTELIPEAHHLSDYCRKSLPGIESRVRLFIDVCAAVAAAHRQRIVHRDLKPSNILVDPDGHPRVIDFGIARKFATAADAHRRMTRSGSAGYESPEQTRGEPLAPTSDVYSLGIILRELLTAASPTTSHLRPNDAGRLHGANRTPVPRSLERIVDRCLSHLPDGRYSDAGALEEGLRTWLRWRSLLLAVSPLARWFGRITRSWHYHRRAMVRGFAWVTITAGIMWMIFLRPDTTSFARAVKRAATIMQEEPGSGLRAWNDARAIWSQAHPFAAPPLELACLAGRLTGTTTGRLVAEGAETMVLGGRHTPWTAVGYPGGIALFAASRPPGGQVLRLGTSVFVNTIKFTADGGRLLAGTADGDILFWETAAFSPNPIDTSPRRIKASTQRPPAIRVIDVPAGKVRGMDWGVALDAEGGILRFDMPSAGPQPRMRPLTRISDAHSVVLLAEGRLLAVAKESGFVEIRPVARPDELVRSESLGPGPINVARDPTGRMLYAASPNRVYVWRTPESAPPASVALGPAWQGTRPRVILAAEDAFLVSRSIDGKASLHCFRDVRSRLEISSRWRETLALDVPTEPRAAVVTPAAPATLTLLDARGFLTTAD